MQRNQKLNFPTNPNAYTLTEVIGRGTCSRIYKALCKTNSQVIVIKIIELEEYPLSLETITKQTAFWSTAQHPNIVGYYGSFIVGSNLWILSEYMAGGSLFDILKFGYGSGIKDESIIAYIAQQVVTALDYLHENKEIHRDIRSGNILINSHGEVKLSDFGMATSLIQEGRKRSAAISMYGDACYMAPEILTDNKGYTPKTDIWSFGLVIIELVTGKMPYDGMKFMESMLQIISKEPPKLSKEGHSSLLVDFVDRCLKTDPSKRASAAELREHKFLKMSKGPGPVITTILSKLPPLEQRYNLLYGDPKDEIQEEVVPKKPEFQWTFDDQPPPQKQPEKQPQQPQQQQSKLEELLFGSSQQQDNNNESKSKQRTPITFSGKPRPKVEETNPTNLDVQNPGPVQKVGRFSIQRNPSMNALNSEEELVKNMQFEIKQLKHTLNDLETENKEIKDKISQITDVIKQYTANHQIQANPNQI